MNRLDQSLFSGLGHSEPFQQLIICCWCGESPQCYLEAGQVIAGGRCAKCNYLLEQELKQEGEES